MSIPIHKMKRFDLQPYYYFHFRDSLDNDIDVSSATILVNMIHPTSLTTVISRQSTGITFTDTVFGDDASKGKGHYAWASSDTAIAGLFSIEFEVTPASGQGGKFTFPSDFDEPALVKISSGFDNI